MTNQPKDTLTPIARACFVEVSAITGEGYGISLPSHVLDEIDERACRIIEASHLRAVAQFAQALKEKAFRTVLENGDEENVVQEFEIDDLLRSYGKAQ